MDFITQKKFFAFCVRMYFTGTSSMPKKMDPMLCLRNNEFLLQLQANITQENVAKSNDSHDGLNKN